MARRASGDGASKRREPVRLVENEKFESALAQACKVCEGNATLARYSHIMFKQGRFQAHDGVTSVQGKSVFDRESEFAVSEARLAQALTLIFPAEKIEETDKHVRFKRGPLSVRVRKVEASTGFYDHFKMSKQAKPAGNLLEALQAVAPFVSDDATRPWSVSVLLADGYAFATNNLALVRYPLNTTALFGKKPVRIPSPAVRLFKDLPSIEHVEMQENHLVLHSGDLLYRCVMVTAPWPDTDPFFKKMPKRLHKLPEDMKIAATTAAKLSDRFTSVKTKQVDSSAAVLEASYEVEIKEGKGVFSAKLLQLISEHATHADFSFFPDPIFFRGPKLEGTAVGAKVAVDEDSR